MSLNQIFAQTQHMPINKSDKRAKALIISPNKSIKAVIRFILGDLVSCQSSRSAPDGKLIFKSALIFDILILDWCLQDKYGSILKCLTEAKARKNVLIINIFESEEQKKWAYQKLPNIKNNNKIYSVFSDFMSISLSLALLKVKARIAEKS